MRKQEGLMKVNKMSVFVGEETRATRREEKAKKGLSENKTVDGSALQAKFDPVEEKRRTTRKRAMRIVGDAFKNERKIDDELNERREKVGLLQQDMADAGKGIKELEERRAKLREAYGVEPDSQEEKDLRLLEKNARASRVWSDIHLTEEEQKRVMEIREGGLTDYQQESMMLLGYEGKYEKESFEAFQEMKIETQIIRATELERLKTHPMVDAEKQAEKVLKEGSKEIVGLLIDETKEHVEKEAEEAKEKAKEQVEKEEKQKERIDAAKEKREEMKEFVEDILDGAKEISTVKSEVSTAQQEVRNMMSKMKMIEEEIKGAAVDEIV